MKRFHGRLHYNRKFQIFIFLIGHINVNKGVFCLMNSYLQIKSYNVLNYNNCSTDWPFRLWPNTRYQQLLRKMQRKISCTDGMTDGQTDRGKTVYRLPLWGAGGDSHIIMIPSQSVFVLMLYCRVLSREATHTNCIVFDLTRRGLENYDLSYSRRGC
jgi:hypothetical protein